METVLSDLLEALQHQYPRGISFDPMSMRLLRQSVDCDDEQIESLKSCVLFQMKNNLWYSSGMILDSSSLVNLKEQASRWLENYGCFSVESLSAIFNGEVHNLIEIDDWACFLQFQNFIVSKSSLYGYICTIKDCNIDDMLLSIAKNTIELLDNNDGIISLDVVESSFPSLTAFTLESIRKKMLPRVTVTDIRGITYWSNTSNISLPNDFSEKLTEIVETFQLIGERLTKARLEFALNLFYKMQFRHEYNLSDDDTFLGLCAEYYDGSDVFFCKGKKKCNETECVDVVISPKQRHAIVEKNQNICEVIGLRGEKLSPITWASFKRDGTDLAVAEWVRRIQAGESLLKIALETGYALPTLRGRISNYDLYFKVCQKNGIDPKKQEEQ